jgi:hypothetical protein
MQDFHFEVTIFLDTEIISIESYQITSPKNLE